MALNWANFPGARRQEDTEALWHKVKDYIAEVGRRQYFHTVQGGSGFAAANGDTISPVTLKAPTDESRTPPLEPEALDVFLYWPPPPPEYEGKKRPVLLFLHGANVSKDEQGICALGAHAWFLDRLPKEVVVVIPVCNSRARRPWVSATVKATLLYAVDKAIESGGDPDRVYVTGLSMGGIATWELAMDAAEGRAPFAAAVPVCGMILNTQRLPALADYPLWCVHAANDIVNVIDDDDSAMNAIMAAGANQGDVATLHYTRIEKGPGEIDLISGTPSPMSTGHLVHEVAYADEEIWTWLFQQRRDPGRYSKPGVRLRDGTIVPGGRLQAEVDELRPSQDHLYGLVEVQRKHLMAGGKELVVPGRKPIPPIRLQAERDPSRKPPLEPEPLDFFFVWPPKPEKSPEDKRPALLFLHGGEACQEEGGLAVLANDVFFLPRVPEEMVVIIPQARSRKHHWLLRDVKATLLFAIEKVVKLGVDPDRVYVTGFSMGGTAAFEFALSSVEGHMPFAASVPVTPYVMSVKRASLLADFPTWIFYGCKEWDSLVARVDDAIETAVEAGANRFEEPNLLCTKYAWVPEPEDPMRHMLFGTWSQAYSEPDLWGWLLSQRRQSTGNKAITMN